MLIMSIWRTNTFLQVRTPSDLVGCCLTQSQGSRPRKVEFMKEYIWYKIYNIYDRSGWHPRKNELGLGWDFDDDSVGDYCGDQTTRTCYCSCMCVITRIWKVAGSCQGAVLYEKDKSCVMWQEKQNVLCLWWMVLAFVHYRRLFWQCIWGHFKNRNLFLEQCYVQNSKRKRCVEPQQSTLKDIDYKTDHNLTKRNAIHCRCTRETLQKACKFARHMGWVSPEPSITILQRRLNTRWQRRWGRRVRNNRRSCKDCCGEGWYCTRGWYILVGGKTNSGNGNFLWFIFSPPRLL